MDEPQAPLTEALSDLERVIAFLDGSAKLEGSWYGQPSKHNAQFWWRINLREAMERLRAALSTAPVQGVLTDEKSERCERILDLIDEFGGEVRYETHNGRPKYRTSKEVRTIIEAILRAALASAPHPLSNTLGDASGPGDPVASLPTPPIAAGSGLSDSTNTEN